MASRAFGSGGQRDNPIDFTADDDEVSFIEDSELSITERRDEGGRHMRDTEQGKALLAKEDARKRRELRSPLPRDDLDWWVTKENIGKKGARNRKELLARQSTRAPPRTEQQTVDLTQLSDSSRSSPESEAEPNNGLDEAHVLAIALSQVNKHEDENPAETRANGKSPQDLETLTLDEDLDQVMMDFAREESEESVTSPVTDGTVEAEDSDVEMGFGDEGTELEKADVEDSQDEVEIGNGNDKIGAEDPGNQGVDVERDGVDEEQAEMDDEDVEMDESTFSSDVPLEYAAIRNRYRDAEKQFHREYSQFGSAELMKARVQGQREREEATEKHRVGGQRRKGSSSTPLDPNWLKTYLKSAKPSNSTFSVTITTHHPNAPATNVKKVIPISQFTPDKHAPVVPFGKAFYASDRGQVKASQVDMFFWPAIVEEIEEEAVSAGLKGYYINKTGIDRKLSLEYLQRGKVYAEFLQEFLEDLNLSEELMLKYILDSSYDEDLLSQVGTKPQRSRWERIIQNLRKQVDAADWWTDQGQHAMIEPTRHESHATTKTKFQYLALVYQAVAADNPFSPATKETKDKWSVWWMLIHSPTLKMSRLLPKLKSVPQADIEYCSATHFDLACRICHLYACSEHGLASEFDQQRGAVESEWQLQPVHDYLDGHWKQGRARRPVYPPSGKQTKDIEFTSDVDYDNPNVPFRTDPQQSMDILYFPCDHEGPCIPGICRCAHKKGKGFCEKGCGCPPTCTLRFQGCKCAESGKACASQTICPCRKVKRECDPDLCGTCGVFESLDPENRSEPKSFFVQRCRNCDIQRGVSVGRLIGNSTSHGMGKFAGTDYEKGEFVVEYIGHGISYNEGERAGTLSLFDGFSYLLATARDQQIDSATYGNTARYANCPERGEAHLANLQLDIRLCNGVYRAALWASKNIKAGTELLWDYGDDYWIAHNGSNEKEKTAGNKLKSTKRSKARRSIVSSDPTFALNPKGKQRQAEDGKVVAVKQTRTDATTTKTGTRGRRRRATSSASSTTELESAMEEMNDVQSGQALDGLEDDPLLRLVDSDPADDDFDAVSEEEEEEDEEVISEDEAPIRKRARQTRQATRR